MDGGLATYLANIGMLLGSLAIGGSIGLCVREALSLPKDDSRRSYKLGYAGLMVLFLLGWVLYTGYKP